MGPRLEIDELCMRLEGLLSTEQVAIRPAWSEASSAVLSVLQPLAAFPPHSRLRLRARGFDRSYK